MSDARYYPPMGENSNERAVWLARHVMPHQLALRRWLSRRFKGVDIDDVIQETYAVLSGLKSVDHIYNPQLYAFQTAYSIVLAQLRRARIVSITAVADLEAMEPAADIPSPETEASDLEELRNVSLAIKSLPERVRKVFTLRRIEGLSQRQVAQRLGISENAVEKCVAKGMQALMEAFDRGGKEGVESPTEKGGAASEELPSPGTLKTGGNKKPV